MATLSSILAWRIPRTEEPGGLQSMGTQESDTTERLNHHHHLEQSSLEGKAWWAPSRPRTSSQRHPAALCPGDALLPLQYRERRP